VTTDGAFGDDARGRLAAAVAPLTGAQGAAAALRLSLAWSVDSIEATTAVASPDAARAPETDDADAAALDTVIAFDDAFTELEQIAAALPGLLRLARTGASVADHLSRQVERLTQLVDQLSRERRDAEAFGRTEDELARVREEYQALQNRREELREAEDKVAMLPDLRAETEALARRWDAQLGQVAAAEAALLESAHQLRTLTEEQSALLSDETRRARETLHDRQRVWAEETETYRREKRELAEWLARFDELTTRQPERLAILRAYELANQDVVARLTAAGPGVPGLTDAVELAESALGRAKELLRQTDEALARALRTHRGHAEAARRLIDWTD